MARVGVLALQGGYQPHLLVLRNLGHEAVEVRSKDELKRVDGLILPGGESTAQLRLIERQNLGQPLNDFVHAGKAVLATCAGLILAARRVVHPEQPSLGWLDLTVERNAWGRQLDSFEAEADRPLFSARCALPLVFIRAPRIQEVGALAEVLATYREEPILVRQGNVWGATFHPELSGNPCVHQAVFGGSNPPSRGPAAHRARAVKPTLSHWIRTLPGVRGLLRWSSATP